MKVSYDSKNCTSAQKELYDKVVSLVGGDVDLVIYEWEGSWSPFGTPTYTCVHSVNGLIASDCDNTSGKGDALNGWRPQRYGVPWNTLLHVKENPDWSVKVRKTFVDYDGNLIEDYDEGFVCDVASLDWQVFTGEHPRTIVRRDLSRVHKKPISPDSPVTVTM